MTPLAGVFAVLLVLSLLLNGLQYVCFYKVRSGLDDTLNELIRVRQNLSSAESAIQRQRIMYQQRMDKQQKQFIGFCSICKKRNGKQETG